MARFRSPRLFSTFRFVVVIPSLGQQLGVAEVFSSPFDGTVWIGRAHQDEGDGGAAETLYHALAGTGRIDVVMFPFGTSRDLSQITARVLGVEYTHCEWVPLDLDAGRNDVALEWIALRGVKYHGPRNAIPAEDPTLSRTFSDL